MPYAIFSSTVNASIDTVWKVMQEKVEHPGGFNTFAQDSKIVDRYENGVLRRIDGQNMTVKERITLNEATKSIRHELVDNAFFTGNTINQVIPPKEDSSDNFPIITYVLDWQPYNNQEAKKVEREIQQDLTEAVQHAVIGTKTLAEQYEAENNASDLKNQKQATATERLPGEAADIIKQLFSRGESFDGEGFASFFTDNPGYQFGNFDVCFDKDAIVKSSDNFDSQISAVYHEIKMMCEVRDVVFVEMDVKYWRNDGSIVTLPCFDVFRFEGNKIAELRIFMDVNPVFDPTIAVPNTASVMTLNDGKIFTPSKVMKRFYSENEAGKQRIIEGFTPKWSSIESK